MECPSCKSDVFSLETIYTPAGKVTQCRECPEKLERQGALNWRQGSSIYSSSGKMTAAHSDDISRRKIGPDGKVYRDYGRRSFTIP